MRILFADARILTMVDDKIIQGNLVVDNNRIVYIGNDASAFTPFDKIVECNGNLLMPGFKNAHAHSAMVFLRNVPQDVTLQEWLFNYVFPREERLIPSDIYYLNKEAYLEYIKGGITFCFEHYFFPLESARAAKEFGMRTLLLGTYSLGNTSTTVDRLEHYCHVFNSEKDGLVRYLVGFHAEYTADETLLNATKEVIKDTKTPFFTHISETQKEVDECYERHQKTPLKYLFEEGLFKYGGGGFHCVHFTDEEIKICKDNHISVITCPGSNKKLGSGTAPISKYLKNNINVALGTDGPASNYDLDMFMEMQLLEANEKETIPPFEVLKMATVNSSKAMGLDEADVLAVNKYADIIMLDLSMPNMNKTSDIIKNIVFYGRKDNVILTMINGQILYENRQFVIKEDIKEIYKKTEEISRRLEKEL